MADEPITVEGTGMAPALRTLRVRLLGTFSLTYSDGAVAGVTTPRLQSLLAYLVLHRDTPQLRQHLAFLFWPDASEAQARNNLRQALHALRLSVPDADTFLTSDASIIQWRPDAPCSLDVGELERALALVESAQAPDAAGTSTVADSERVNTLSDALMRVADLYHADLLPSCYDEWIAPERDRLRQRCLRALAQLAAMRESEGDLPGAIDVAQRIVQHDPLDEEAYRRLMRLLELNGDRTGALRVYHTCADTLRRELGVEPSAATRDIYDRLSHADAVSPALRQSTPSDGTRGASASLVGRRRDWERLLGAWEQARSGGPVLALITGEAGIGKSRLADELLISARRQRATTAKARCYAAEGRLSLAPATDWLRAESMRPHLLQLSPVWLTEVSRVLPELPAEHPGLPPYEPMTEFGQRRRFFEALARAVFAAPQPLLLLIDDLQWCDEETLEWLHYLLRFDPAAHLLVVGTARAEDLSPRHPLRSLLLHVGDTVAVVEIALPPLDAGETARLAEQIAHRELSTSAAMRLYRETEGNPLFVVETMRAGLDALMQAETPRPAAEHDPASVAALPPRVRAVIAGRLAQLSAETRDVCTLAAAVGRAFRLDVLAHAAGAGEDAAVRALDELWQRRIVREQGANTYDFTHDKLREVAYAEISAPQRRMLHRRIAQALEAVHADDLDPVSAQIAAHFDRAGLARQAIPYYQRASAVAKRVYANEDAIVALTRALALLDQLDAGIQRDTLELALLLALAPLYRITMGWTAPELERVLDRILALCDTVGTDEQRAEALYGFESMVVVQGKLERAEQVDHELHAAYARLGRAVPLSGVMIAGVQLHVGRFASASEAYDQMFAAHDPALSRDLDVHGWNDAVLARAWQSHALWCLGYPDRALACAREAGQIATDLQLPFNQALAMTYLALLQQLRADPVTAMEQAQAAYELTVQYKAPYYQAWAGILLRYAEAWEQPDGDHIALLRSAIEEFAASGARLRLPYYLGLLARLYRRADRLEDGLATIDQAIAESQARDEHWWDAELYRLRAELLVARSADPSAVESVLMQALEIARQQGAKSLELRATMSLSRLWRAHGRVADARPLLTEVFNWFTEGFDTPDLRRARSLLDRLTERS